MNISGTKKRMLSPPVAVVLENNEEQKLAILLEKNIDVNIVYTHPRLGDITPLCHASLYRREPNVRLVNRLVIAGADVGTCIQYLYKRLTSYSAATLFRFLFELSPLIKRNIELKVNPQLSIETFDQQGKLIKTQTFLASLIDFRYHLLSTSNPENAEIVLGLIQTLLARCEVKDHSLLEKAIDADDMVFAEVLYAHGISPLARYPHIQEGFSTEINAVAIACMEAKQHWLESWFDKQLAARSNLNDTFAYHGNAWPLTPLENYFFLYKEDEQTTGKKEFIQWLITQGASLLAFTIIPQESSNFSYIPLGTKMKKTFKWNPIFTVLSAVLFTNNQQMIQELFELFQRLDISAEERQLALQRAFISLFDFVDENQIAHLEILIRAGLELNIPLSLECHPAFKQLFEPCGAYSPLSFSCSRTTTDLVALKLIELGAMVNVDVEMAHPLTMAVVQRNMPLVRSLLASGAKPIDLSEASRGASPLASAFFYDVKILRLILAQVSDAQLRAFEDKAYHQSLIFKGLFESRDSQMRTCLLDTFPNCFKEELTKKNGIIYWLIFANKQGHFRDLINWSIKMNGEYFLESEQGKIILKLALKFYDSRPIFFESLLASLGKNSVIKHLKQPGMTPLRAAALQQDNELVSAILSISNKARKEAEQSEKLMSLDEMTGQVGCTDAVPVLQTRTELTAVAKQDKARKEPAALTAAKKLVLERCFHYSDVFGLRHHAVTMEEIALKAALQQAIIRLNSYSLTSDIHSMSQHSLNDLSYRLFNFFQTLLAYQALDPSLKDHLLNGKKTARIRNYLMHHFNLLTPEQIFSLAQLTQQILVDDHAQSKLLSTKLSRPQQALNDWFSTLTYPTQVTLNVIFIEQQLMLLENNLAELKNDTASACDISWVNACIWSLVLLGERHQQFPGINWCITDQYLSICHALRNRLGHEPGTPALLDNDLNVWAVCAMVDYLMSVKDHILAIAQEHEKQSSLMVSTMR